MADKTSTVSGNTIVLENLLQKDVIMLKKNMNIIKQVANTKYTWSLSQSWDTVTVEQFPLIRWTRTWTSWANIATKWFAISSFNLVIDQVYQNWTELTKIEMKQSNLDLSSKVSTEFAYDSARDEDNFVWSFASEAYAWNVKADKAPITLDKDNVFGTFRDLKTRLSKVNAYKNEMVLFVNPDISATMEIAWFLTWTEQWAEIGLNWYRGKFAGFRTLETNQLPHVVSLTLDTIAVDTNTMTVWVLNAAWTVDDVVFTFTAASAAANPWDIAIWANVAANQVNIIDAINWTWTASAATYIAISDANRDIFTDGWVQIKWAFDSDEKVNFQSYEALEVSETFGPATDIFWVDAVLAFVADNQAINYVSQLDEFSVEKVVWATRSVITNEKVYGWAVLGENAKWLATVEIVTL